MQKGEVILIWKMKNLTKGIKEIKEIHLTPMMRIRTQFQNPLQSRIDQKT